MALPRELSQEEQAELKARGFQRFEIWLPDLREPAARAQALAEADRIAFADNEDDIMQWVEAHQKEMWNEGNEQ